MSRPDPMQLLQEALRVHRAWRAEESPEPPAEFLAHHEELREFLEPLVRGEPAEEEATAERTLGDFRLLREIGRGGMGVVFEARQRSLDRLVALKVLPAHLTLQPSSIARFRREALMAAGLDHPGLVKVHVVGDEGDTNFFAMDFVEGAPLSRVLEEAADQGLAGLDGPSISGLVRSLCHRPSSQVAPEAEEAPPSAVWNYGYVDTVLGIVVQVADALDHAHAAGVIHRDVKPGNILVREDGSAVLTDFGLAREAGVPTMTMTGEFLGTPHYVSPEQAAGRTVDHRTDVFSLGATLYELLTLQRPFGGETTHDVLDSIRRHEPADPRRRNPRLPADLAAIVLKALEKVPDRRYQSASEFAADLRAFLAYRPVQARPLTPTVRALRWARREPLRAALVLVLAVGIPVLAGLGGYVLAQQGTIRVGAETLREQEIEELLSAGFLSLDLDGGTSHESLAAFREVLDLEDTNVEALMGIAMVWWSARKYDRLREHLEESGAHLTGIRLAHELDGIARKELALPPPPDRRGAQPGPMTALESYLEGVRAYLEAPRALVPGLGQRVTNHIRRAILVSPRPRRLFFQHLADLASTFRLDAPAREAADGLATLWPDSHTARLHLAAALLHLEPARALDILRSLPEELTTGPTIRAKYRMKLALCLQESGEHADALVVYDQLLAEESLGEKRKAAIHYNASMSYEVLGQVDEKIARLRQALEVYPGYVRAANNLALSLRKRGKLDEAREILQRVSDDHPEYALGHHNLAAVLEKQKRIGPAIEALRRALAAEPGNYESRYKLAKLLRRGGKTAEAGEHYVELVQLEPKDPRAYIGLGLNCLKSDLKEAGYWCRRAVEVDPDHTSARTNLSYVLANQGNYEATIPHLRHALQVDPRHRFAHQNLVMYLGKCDRHAEAVAELGRRISLVPDDSWSLVRLADYHAGNKLAADERDLEQGLGHARRAVEVSRGRDPSALVVLADLQAQNGDKEGSRRTLEKARALLKTGRVSARAAKAYRARIERTMRRLEQ